MTNTQAPDDITLAKNQLLIDIYNTLLRDNQLSMELRARIGNTIRHLVGNRRLQLEQPPLPPSLPQHHLLSAIQERRLPPGWVKTTNEFGRPIFQNQVTGEILFAFPEAASIDAELASAPSAPPPLDPVLIERVKTNYYPNISEFSRIPALEIIEMLYSPEMPPSLSQDDVELIINNYVGTAFYRMRKGDSHTISVPYETDILECAKYYFKTNAWNAKKDYSYESPTHSELYHCNIPFKWSRNNERHQTLIDKHSFILASILLPQDTNTVRWLLSSNTTPIPSIAQAQQNMFVLQYYHARTDFDATTQSIKIGEVRKRMEYMTSDAYRVQQALEVKQKKRKRNSRQNSISAKSQGRRQITISTRRTTKKRQSIKR